MKPLLFILILCIPLLIFSQEIVSEKTISINANFNGRHCRGDRGICAIDAKNNQEANATIEYSETNNTITISIIRTKINESETLQILGNPIGEENNFQFIMDDDYIFQPSLLNLLKINSAELKILKGSYPIEITNDTFILKINLE